MNQKGSGMGATLTIEGEGIQVIFPNAIAVPTSHTPESVGDGALSYGVVEAAKLTGINDKTLRQAIYSGDLKARMNGRTYLILREDLHDFLTRLPEFEPAP